MASLAAATKRTKREDIKKGTIFYVKWDMEDGNSKYFKAIATGENKGGKFVIRYTEDGSTEIRKRSTIDDRSKTLITKETYNNTISAYPPKKPSVGEEHQVELPQVGTDTSQHRALSMVHLTPEEVLRDDGKPFANKESEVDMNRAGRSKDGWGRRRRRKKTRKRKSRKKRKSRRKKRKTKKRKMRKNKKTRKRKQKGRGANICKMISDPDKKNELKVMALSRAKRARRAIPLHPETGEPLTSLLSMLEAHNYCHEMNNDNYRCDPGSGMCEKVDSEAVKNVINGMLSGRGFK